MRGCHDTPDCPQQAAAEINANQLAPIARFDIEELPHLITGSTCSSAWIRRARRAVRTPTVSRHKAQSKRQLRFDDSAGRTPARHWRSNACFTDIAIVHDSALKMLEDSMIGV
jgi:hypothetical protein